MRTILSLALAVVMVTGVAVFSGCDKGGTKHTTETKDKQVTAGGGEKETKTTTESKETPPKDNK